jgi:hypothetical protein
MEFIYQELEMTKEIKELREKSFRSKTDRQRLEELMASLPNRFNMLCLSVLVHFDIYR